MNRLSITASALATVLLCCETLSAQTYVMRTYSIDCGGGFSSDELPAGFELTGAIGQADASDGTMTGGGFTMMGGFVPSVSALLPPPMCPGDVNGDRVVDLSDLAILLAHFGTASGATLADGDLNGDGDVELDDLALLLSHFGSTCP